MDAHRRAKWGRSATRKSNGSRSGRNLAEWVSVIRTRGRSSDDEDEDEDEDEDDEVKEGFRTGKGKGMNGIVFINERTKLLLPMRRRNH